MIWRSHALWVRRVVVVMVVVAVEVVVMMAQGGMQAGGAGLSVERGRVRHIGV
jgi:hypothetical protein